jgi:hypothetical protein
MKLLTLILLLVATPVEAQDKTGVWPVGNPGVTPYRYVGSGVTPIHIKSKSDEARAAHIRAWADSGEICRVLGHRWELISITYAYPTNPPTYGPQRRKCELCGKIETKVEEWK